MWNEPLPVWRKARKQHQCQGEGCTKVIALGDRYLDKSLREPQHGHLRYCVACGEPVLESAKSYHFFNRSDFPERYQERIGSSQWKELRLKVIEQRGGCCQRCGNESRDLELHHLHYRSLGSEALEDVELLCQSCHVRADEARVSRHRPNREISDEGWIVGPDGDGYWGTFDRDTIYVPLADGRYAPVISKAKH